MASLDPVNWLVSLVGFLYDWLLSRLVEDTHRHHPAVAVGRIGHAGLGRSSAGCESIGGSVSGVRSAEIGDWETRLVSNLISRNPGGQTGAASPTDATASVEATAPADATTPAEAPQPTEAIGSAEDDTQPAAEGEPSAPSNDAVVSPYGEMLYKRAQLLRPSPESQFVVGTTLVQHGAVVQGQKILKTLAPDDSQGQPKAHAIMALSYLSQYAKSPNADLVPLLTHHAEASVPWEHTPKEVLLIASDINWQKRNFDRSLEIFGVASERYPELYPALAERAAAVGKSELAEESRQHAVEHYQKVLQDDPQNDQVRVQIAQLMSSSEGGLEASEKLLKEAPNLADSPLIVRALSEINRIRFVKYFSEAVKNREDGSPPIDTSFLEQALEIDPTNPLISEQTAIMIRDGIKPGQKLSAALKQALDSQTASVGTHMIMSEYYLARNARPEAIKHLERVYEAAPMVVKYANNLAWLYAAEDRTEDALKTARGTIELLQRNNLQNAQFMDDLLTIHWV